MGLTPQMINWNRRIEELIKEEKNKTKLNEAIPPEVIPIYNEIERRIANFGDIKITKTKQYIAFKAKKNIVDLELHKTFIKAHINLRKGELDNPKNLARDVSKIGHFGNGDYELNISSTNDIDYLIYLAKQSYIKNSI